MKRFWTDIISDAIPNDVDHYHNFHSTWHWFQSTRYKLKTMKQFHTWLCNNFDGLTVYKLLNLYEEYKSSRVKDK